MSAAVVEREAASLEELEAALERKRERLRASSANLLDLVQEEQVALDEFLRLTPDKNPWTVGTKPQRKHDEVVKVEHEIANLEKTIGVLVGHLNEAGALRAVERLRELTQQVEKLSKADDALWRKLGHTLAEEILPAWNKLAESFEAREALRGEVERSNLLEPARFLDADVASAFDQVIDFPSPRVPIDIGGLIEMLLEMCFDPHNHGYRESANGGDRRYGSHLPGLVPDLKGRDRRAELSAGHAGQVGIFGGSNQPGSQFTLS